MSSRKTITHEQLVKAAKVWLAGSKHCRVVATELMTDAMEIPDAIGWSHQGESIVVECKTSRADFQRDKKKSQRRWGGVGRERWYLTTPGLLRKDEVPEGWGLAEYRKSEHVRGYFVRTIVTPPKDEIRPLTENEMFEEVHRHRLEKQMLVSIAWRALEALSLVGRLGIGLGDCDESEISEGRERRCQEKERVVDGEGVQG